ncbi:reverse transcriptase-rnase h-integrase, partial [Moniliophthora roreri]
SFLTVPVSSRILFLPHYATHRFCVIPVPTFFHSTAHNHPTSKNTPSIRPCFPFLFWEWEAWKMRLARLPFRFPISHSTLPLTRTTSWKQFIVLQGTHIPPKSRRHTGKETHIRTIPQAPHPDGVAIRSNQPCLGRETNRNPPPKPKSRTRTTRASSFRGLRK